MTGGSISYEADLAAYYLNEMTEAAEAGDVEAGRSAEEKRNAVIDASAISASSSRDEISAQPAPRIMICSSPSEVATVTRYLRPFSCANFSMN